MRIESFRHKGLRLFFEEDSVKGIEASTAPKLRQMLSVMVAATGINDLAAFPGWRPHLLKGALAGTWSLVVTANWRLTFHYDEVTNTARILDLVDYH